MKAGEVYNIYLLYLTNPKTLATKRSDRDVRYRMLPNSPDAVSGSSISYRNKSEVPIGCIELVAANAKDFSKREPVDLK